MKKILSLLITAATLATTLLSCASSGEMTGSTGITAVSASASDYALWLEERLDTIPDGIVMGIGDGSEYGVNLDNFEDDGYIIRSMGTHTVIFGKTESGLDLAVRKYANEAELNGKVDDFIYHENKRIDSLSLFGTPISKFVIEYYGDDTKDAASELYRLVERACGTKLMMFPGYCGCSTTIAVKISDDDALDDKGFRYFENNGSLVIEGAGRNACLMGVYSFLENECGWDGLLVGDSALSDSRSIDVPTGLDVTVIPAFDFVTAHPNIEKSFNTDRNFPIYDYTSTATDVFDDAFVSDGVCFSSEEFYESIRNIVLDYAKDNGTAEIDLSPLTGCDYCKCDACAEILEAEGCTAGSAIRFFNRLAEEIEDVYPDITYRLTVTDNTVAPISAEPEDKIHIAFTLDRFCINHSIGSVPYNHECSEALESWLSHSDNVSVIIPKDCVEFHQYTLIHTLFEKIGYLYNAGVKGIYFDAPYNGLGIERIEYLMMEMLCRNINMDEEDFAIQLSHLLRKEYGPGWEYIGNYLKLWTEAESAAGCIISGSNAPNGTRTLRHYNRSVSLLRDAAYYVENSVQLERCTLLSHHVYYNECRARYFNEYFSGNTEGIEQIDKKYSSLLDTLENIGETPLYTDLYSVAWRDWVNSKDVLYSGEEDFSPSNDYLDFAKCASANTGDGKLTFAFKTDSHFTEGNSTSGFESFAHLQEYIPLDFYVHGGDLMNGNHATEQIAINSISTAFNSMRTIHSAPFVSLRGNHDDNSWLYNQKTGSKYGVYPTDGIVDTTEWLKCGFTRSPEIVTDGKGPYGYLDHEESKIRILFVDTSDIPYEANEDGIFHYGSYAVHGIRNDQLNFMAKAMEFEDKGEDAKNWAILIISHVPMETMRSSTSTYRFGIPDALPRNNFAFLRLVKAYQRGETFDETQTTTTNYGDGGLVQGSHNDVEGDFSYSVKADFSKNGPGEVIGFICGHTHTDNLATNVGKVSYNHPYGKIYPKLSDGYVYISTNSSGFIVVTVDRASDGCGTIYVDKYGRSTVAREDMIAPGDNATASTDPSVTGITATDPDTGSVASGHYSVNYYQNR